LGTAHGSDDHHGVVAYGWSCDEGATAHGPACVRHFTRLQQDLREIKDLALGRMLESQWS
jgi:hypothetical protein